ncbi:phosphonatase-like hydrolase [Rhabdobacter roseus]|uniref:Phosphonatase-like hydrolase n=1 Tax=Rhabdobacter roseus TaxID=1655419 RepID=A0A840TSH9_9BACT|nr:HAD family hydrolase [Rhabdobacter roseus]MBB5284223.1 phosphonatase-like hydrolase [Rhabdobacter roseus]
MIRLVTLDMAGTTVTDQHEVEACFAEAARKTGLVVSDDRILAMQGLHKYSVFQTLWEETLGSTTHPEWQMRVDKSYKVFTEVLENHYLTHSITPTEGCPELFDFLHEQGIAIALTTGFYRKVADIILQRLGWLNGLNEQRVGSTSSRIQASVTSDEVEKGRPHPFMIQKAMQVLGVPDPAQVINVGDTPSDIQSGRAAGCRLSVAVINGTHRADQLAPHQPDRLLDSLFDLIPLIQEINATR